MGDFSLLIIEMDIYQIADKVSTYHGDAIEWLNNQIDNSLSTVITGLPDLSEITDYVSDMEGYKSFLNHIVTLIGNKVRDDQYIIFIQTDRRHNGVWIDKSFEIMKTMESIGIPLRFHKIVCSSKTLDLYRVCYSHILCFSKTRKYSIPFRDIIPASYKTWANAVSITVLVELGKFLNKQGVTHIIDPFAGYGTIGLVMRFLNIHSWNIELDIDTYERMEQNITDYKFNKYLLELIKI